MAQKNETARKRWDASASEQLYTMLRQLPDLEEEYRLFLDRKSLLPPSVPMLDAPRENHLPSSHPEDVDEGEAGWMKDALHLIEQGDIGSWLNEKQVEKDPSSEEEGEEEEEDEEEDEESIQKAGKSRRKEESSLCGRRQPSSETLTGTKRSSRLRSLRKKSSDDVSGLVEEGGEGGSLDTLSEEQGQEGEQEEDVEEEGKQGKAELTFTNLMKHLHLPSKKARDLFGFKSAAGFVKALANVGIKKWPHRTYMCLRNLLTVLESDRHSYAPQEHQQSQLIHQVQQEITKLTQSPNDYQLPSSLKAVSKSVAMNKHIRHRKQGAKERTTQQALAGGPVSQVLNKLIENRRRRSSQLEKLTPPYLVVPLPPPLSNPSLPPHVLPAPPTMIPQVWPQQQEQHSEAMRHVAMQFHSQIDDQIRLLQAQQQRILITTGIIPIFNNPSIGPPFAGGPPLAAAPILQPQGNLEPWNPHRQHQTLTLPSEFPLHLLLPPFQ